MPRLFLSHLLAVCLLLSQLPAEIHGQRKKPKNTDVVKLCGSELAVYWIRLCGNLNWDRMALSPTEPGLTSGPLAEIMQLILTKDTDASPQERQSSLREPRAALEDSNLNLEEFKENMLTRQSEAEDNSQTELENTGAAKRFPQVRSLTRALADKCCNYGCYRGEMARFCLRGR